MRSIGAAAISREDRQLHPTAAGMLMFGEEYNIVRHFPEYFLDYREMLDPAIRWTDRLQSSSGEWSGNICDFYFRVYNKIIMDVKKPKKLVLENPGYIRTGKIQMCKGGESDPRNKSLMKMFNLINIGERSGSGVPNIFNTWEDEGWKEPVIEERFDPDRTILTLEFVEKQVRKASEENKQRKQAKKTSGNIAKIYEYLAQHGEAKTNEIADYIGLSPARTRAIISEMENIERIGTNTNRKYKLKKADDDHGTRPVR